MARRRRNDLGLHPQLFSPSTARSPRSASLPTLSSFVNMKSILSIALLATTALAARRCGSDNPSAQQMAISKALAEQEETFSISSDGNFSIQATIPTYFHIVSVRT